MILIFSVVAVLGASLITRFVYGGFISKRQYDFLIREFDNEIWCWLNSLDYRIICTNTGHVSSVPFSIFGKYYYDSSCGSCLIPFWHPAHKLIKNKYKHLHSVKHKQC